MDTYHGPSSTSIKHARLERILSVPRVVKQEAIQERFPRGMPLSARLYVPTGINANNVVS